MGQLVTTRSHGFDTAALCITIIKFIIIGDHVITTASGEPQRGGHSQISVPRELSVIGYRYRFDVTGTTTAPVHCSPRRFVRLPLLKMLNG